MCNRQIKGKTVYLHNLEKTETNTEETTLIVESSCSWREVIEGGEGQDMCAIHGAITPILLDYQVLY